MQRFTPLLMAAALLLAACNSAPVAQSPTAVPTEAAPPTPTVEPTPAATPTPLTLSSEEIAEKLRPATVRIAAIFGENAVSYEGQGSGTGIVYDAEQGLILTNAHVVEGASAVEISLAGSTRTRAARVIGRSQCDDLAVLKVENTQDLEAATLGESSAMRVGADVVAIGYPLSDQGDDISVTKGNISQLNVAFEELQDLIKHDAPINPGNSGGPLVNNRGEVIGINVLTLTNAQNQNYAIAMTPARPIIKELESGKNRHYIGLNLYPNVFEDYFGTNEGMAIVAVASGSPASQVGVQPADLLLKIEDTSVNSAFDVCRILRSHADGDQLKVRILRATTGEILEGELTLGKVGPADDRTAKLAVVGTIAMDEPSAEPEPVVDPEDDGTVTLVNNTFDGDDVGTWPVGDGDGLSARVADGRYTVELTDVNLYAFIYPDESVELTDGVIAAEVQPEGDGLAGVMARFSESNDQRSMYVCWISNNGKAGCSKNVNNTWSVIVQPQTSAAVKPNDYNIIALAVKGNMLVFVVNDTEIARITDESLSSGAWGVYVENFDSSFRAHYNEIAVLTGN